MLFVAKTNPITKLFAITPEPAGRQPRTLPAKLAKLANCHRYATRRARPRRSGPAATPQYLGHLPRGIATFPPNLAPAVPQRLLAGRRRVIVAPLVLPALFIRVRLLAVQFDDDRVFLVDAVTESCASVAFLEAHLLAGRRQAVRPFDVPVIPEFEHRMRAIRRRRA